MTATWLLTEDLYIEDGITLKVCLTLPVCYVQRLSMSERIAERGGIDICERSTATVHHALFGVNVDGHYLS